MRDAFRAFDENRDGKKMATSIWNLFKQTVYLHYSYFLSHTTIVDHALKKKEYNWGINNTWFKLQGPYQNRSLDE